MSKVGELPTGNPGWALFWRYLCSFVGTKFMATNDAYRVYQNWWILTIRVWPDSGRVYVAFGDDALIA